MNVYPTPQEKLGRYYSFMPTDLKPDAKRDLITIALIYKTEDDRFIYKQLLRTLNGFGSLHDNHASILLYHGVTRVQSDSIEF